MDAVREIESHIAEGQAVGKPATSILARLGHPRTLAKAYLADYYLQNPQGRIASVQHFLVTLLFFTTTGFISLLIVPVFGLLAFTFALSSVLMPIAGVLRLFGVPGIFMIRDVQMPIFWALPASLLLSSIFALLTWGIVKLFRMYCRLISAGYQRVLPRRSFSS